jgi:hypothetical protein
MCLTYKGASQIPIKLGELTVTAEEVSSGDRGILLQKWEISEARSMGSEGLKGGSGMGRDGD